MSKTFQIIKAPESNSDLGLRALRDLNELNVAYSRAGLEQLAATVAVMIGRLLAADDPVGTKPPEAHSIGEHVLRPILYPDAPETAPSRLGGVLWRAQKTGQKCGLQVLAPDRVIAWIGDIADARAPLPLWDVRAPGPIFHDCRGPDALNQATNWLQAKGAGL